MNRLFIKEDIQIAENGLNSVQNNQENANKIAMKYHFYYQTGKHLNTHVYGLWAAKIRVLSDIAVKLWVIIVFQERNFISTNITKTMYPLTPQYHSQ